MKKIIATAVFATYLVLNSFAEVTVNHNDTCNARFDYAISDSLMIYTNDGYELFLRSECRSDLVYHKWKLSNGLESDERDPTFTINSADSVLEVCHEIVDQSGILDSYCELIFHMYNPTPGCYADFTFYSDPTVNCNCIDAYQFIDQSAENPVRWKWSFGDGDSSELQNPVHAFNDSGFYRITLQITTADSCQSEKTKYIIVRAGDDCNLQIGYSVLESYPPQYQFYCNVYDPRLMMSYRPPEESDWDNALRYLWEFGDGNYSTDPFATHVYNESGEYKVTLVIAYADGFTCTAVLSDYFTGSDNSIDCDYRGMFYRNYKGYGIDAIIMNSGGVLHVRQIIPKIYLPDSIFIRFGYEDTGDTLFMGDEVFRTVVVNCVYMQNQCELTGTVRDYTGLDGCGYLIELDNGTRLEPILKDSLIRFYDKQRVRLSYVERTDIMSICMAGIIAEITCIEEMEPDTFVPAPYCEQIMLNTSFALNGGYCSGTASIDIITPCNAWMYYEMIMSTEYQVLWSTGETTRSISGLCPGNLYFVNVTNPVTGRTYSAAFSIFQLNNVFPSWTFTRNENTYRFNLPVDDTYTVTWEFDDGISLVGEDVSYTYQSGGNHMVEMVVKDESGTEVYSETIQLAIPSIIPEQATESLSVFPNPANDILSVSLASHPDESVSISIYNFSGQLMIKQNFIHIAAGDVTSLDISDLRPGIYLLVMMNENGGSQSIKFEKH